MQTIKQLPDTKFLRSNISYNSETGELTWKIPGPRRRVGDLAFNTVDRDGYLTGIITYKGEKKRYSAHRIAWKLHYGSDPVGPLDHINHDPQDNRIANLREATLSENARNRRTPRTNTSGHINIGQQGSKFYVRVYDPDGKRRKIYFDSMEEAIAASPVIHRENGYHENHGK